VEVLEAQQRVDVQRGERLGLGGRDLLDVHAALGGQHDQRGAGAAVEDDGGVELGGDVARRLDPHLVDLEALDVHAEDRVRVLARLVGVLGDLDAAGLAASSDEDLGLDDAGVPDLVGGRDHLGDGGRGASGRNGDVVAGEELLALIFEEVHRRA
jgi:hypothetical protein